MIETKTNILHQERIAPQIFRLCLSSPGIAQEARPGQFVHLRIREGTDPLLRRPFSIHRVDRERGEVRVLYQVVGQGTRLLSRKSVGERLACLGPLGHGFEVSEEGGGVLLVAGGIGMAPLIFLCEDLLRGQAVTALIGARSRDGILCHDLLRSGGATVHIATDDGSLGHRGLVTDLLNAQLEAGREASASPVVYACGPVAMLRTVAALCRANELPCQVSLESRMACGLGACLGCAVKVRSSIPPGYEYKRVCKEGPVFEAEEVIFDENLLSGH
jgi:dihydroorotate dehydrogenase electron transfer subunit